MQDLLEPYAVDLVDIAGGDAAAADEDGANTVSSMSAFAVLDCVLAVLGPSSSGLEAHHSYTSVSFSSAYSTSRPGHTSGHHGDAHYGSTVYMQCLHTLRDRGHVERILLTAGLTTVRGSDKDITERTQHVTEGVFEATLTLCAHLACSSDGTHMLLDLGLLESINNLPLLQVPSVRAAGRHESFSIATADAGHRRRTPVRPTPSSQSDVEVSLIPLLRLLRAMASTSPSVLVLKQCALFMARNHATVSFFLQLHSPSIRGLRLVHAIVSLFCMIAPATVPQLQSSTETKYEPLQTRHSLGGQLASLWEVEMGPRGDAYISDMCKLGRVIGTCLCVMECCATLGTPAQHVGNKHISLPPAHCRC